MTGTLAPAGTQPVFSGPRQRGQSAALASRMDEDEGKAKRGRAGEEATWGDKSAGLAPFWRAAGEKSNYWSGDALRSIGRTRSLYQSMLVNAGADGAWWAVTSDDLVPTYRCGCRPVQLILTGSPIALQQAAGQVA